MTDRELDALVAEKIMGDNLDAGNGRKYCTPPYSTDISAAWEVVEKFRSQGDVILDFYKPDFNYWRCSFGRGTEFTRDESAPKVICLAALKAVGVEV